MLKSVWWRAIDREVAFLNYKDIAFIKKVANFAFFKGVSSKFWAKIWNFFNPFVLGKMGWEKVFDDVPDRKLVFSRLKNIDLGRSPNLQFHLAI